MKIIAIAVMCFTIAIAFSYDFFPKPQRGKKVIEAWETTNNSFKVSVTAYAEEHGGFVPGAYYVFRSARIGSENWQEIMTFRHDDPVPIPRDQVRFVNEQIGYVFMVYNYGVTTDAGATWFVWDITSGLPDWQHNRAYIKDVRIASDGTGTMKLNHILQRPEVLELHTKDYGRHWSVE